MAKRRDSRQRIEARIIELGGVICQVRLLVGVLTQVDFDPAAFGIVAVN